LDLRETLALMENIIVSGGALVLFIYLFVAMVRPEKF
jgi:K+-transporting ATPase KdpF subunit